MINAEQSAQSAPLWKVGVPVQTTIADRTQGIKAAWDVPVIMMDGSTFTITVPADQFNPDNVQKTIEDHVSRLVAIRALEGPQY